MFNNIGLKKTSLRARRAREQSGQATVEYIILVTAVLAVIILLATGPSSLFQTKVKDSVNTTVSQIKDKAETLRDSHDTNVVLSDNSSIIVDPTQNIFH